MLFKIHGHQFGKVRFSLAVAAFVATLGLVTPTNSFAQQFMSQGELLATFPGNQLSGLSNQDGKTPWVQAYSKATRKNDGKLNGLWNGKDKYTGDWFVKGDQWCEKGDWGQKCWSVERLDANEFRIYENGKPKKNTWKLK